MYGILFKSNSCEGMDFIALLQLDADVLCVCVYKRLLEDIQS